MKKTNRSDDDSMRAEYDFAGMKGAVRGKYTARLGKTATLVSLAPDVAAAFPTAAAVNKALREVIRSGKSGRSVKSSSKNVPKHSRRRTITGAR